jgi:serine/threonine protein kinase
MIGQTIGHYEIQELIGDGGFAVVYRALDINLDRYVAVKFLQAQRYSDKEDRERFLLEAKAASRLDHPNICTIYEIETAPNGQLFIVMAYYKGETLRKKLAAGPLLIDDALKYAIDIAQGLAKAHRDQVIHRDVKPENIIITVDEIAKILDFGVAKLVYASPEPEKLVGTIEYMAPEQLRGISDRRTDLWALGVLIYEMVTGRRPFDAPTRFGIMHAIANSPSPAASELRRDVPPELEKLITRALAKNPADRYQSAEEMLVHLHALRHGVQSIPPSSGVRSRRPNSIAVLPFVNVGHDVDAEHFCDGLADELVHLLSQVRGLRVISHRSSIGLTTKDESIKVIGEHLGVTSILEGSVCHAGDVLRITARLTDAVEGFNIWSQRYERELKDLFAIQADIALSIVSRMKLSLRSNIGELRPRYAGDIEAYGFYLKGRHYWEQRTQMGIRKAGECFQKAIAIDPNCAPAYAGLADYFISLGFWSITAPTEAWARGRELARRGLQLDERLAEAEVSLAKCAIFNDWDWRQAEQRFLRAVELDPQLATAHFNYAILLLQLGRFESGLLEMLCARDLDPLSLTAGTGVAWAQYYLGHYEPATQECLKVLELQPDYHEALGCMGMIAAAEGRFADAVSWFERALPISGSPLGFGFVGYAYGLNRSVAKARAVLEDIARMEQQGYVSPVVLALVHIGLSEHEEAMNYLEKAADSRDGFIPYLGVFPPFQSLRHTSRFERLVMRIGFFDEAKTMTV